jgi:hypothetical protein
LAAGLLGGACSLDKSHNQQLAGPSETGLSAQMTVSPDLVNADGVSTAVIDMVLRDANGKPVNGRSVLFCTTGQLGVTPPTGGAPDPTTGDCDGSSTTPPNSGQAGSLNAQAGYTFVGPVQSGIVMATNNEGVARVFWVAGTNRNTTIVVGVRVYGLGDASRGFLQTVQIFQQ